MADRFVEDGNIRHMTMLHRIEILQVNVLTVLRQLRKGLRNAQIESIALRLGLDDAVSVELQAHAADEAIRFDCDQADLFGPAHLGQWRQLMLRQVGSDNERELREVFGL